MFFLRPLVSDESASNSDRRQAAVALERLAQERLGWNDGALSGLTRAQLERLAEAIDAEITAQQAEQAIEKTG